MHTTDCCDLPGAVRVIKAHFRIVCVKHSRKVVYFISYKAAWYYYSYSFAVTGKGPSLGVDTVLLRLQKHRNMYSASSVETAKETSSIKKTDTLPQKHYELMPCFIWNLSFPPFFLIFLFYFLMKRVTFLFSYQPPSPTCIGQSAVYGKCH